MNGKKTIRIIIISFVITAIIIASIIGFILLGEKDELKEEQKESTPYQLGSMYMNLKESYRILKCDIVIEVTDKKLIEVLNRESYQIKHAVNEIVRDKTEKDLEGSEGLQRLETEITQKIGKIFDSKDIYDTYFNEFIVQ